MNRLPIKHGVLTQLIGTDRFPRGLIQDDFIHDGTKPIQNVK